MKVFACLLIAPVLVVAQEEEIPVAKLPPAIVSAVNARFPNTKISSAVRETEDGKTFFEVTIRLNGKNVDVTAMQTGELTLIEREISRKDLPAAVQRLLDTRYPRAKWNLVEDVSTVSALGETLSFYEVLLTDARKEQWEVQVAPDGSKVIKTEKKKPGEPN